MFEVRELPAKTYTTRYLNFEDALWDKVEAEAIRLRMPKTYVIRDILLMYFDALEKKNKNKLNAEGRV